jgi:hypothetical protein
MSKSYRIPKKKENSIGSGYESKNTSETVKNID